MISPRIWLDQQEFNATLRSIPLTYSGKVELTKEFALHMVSELTELLNACGTWAMHRKKEGDSYITHENIRRQLIDILKYWMSIAQVWDYSPLELQETYWRKSATVRQRYAEEFLFQDHLPVAVVDLDNVLVAYTSGFGKWLSYAADHHNILDSSGWPVNREKLTYRIQECIEKNAWFGASELNISQSSWSFLQHKFRSSGGFRHLDAMPHAEALVAALRHTGRNVVGLTSRPIGDYPNIYDDTLSWLTDHHIVLDAIWWGSDKAEKLARCLPNALTVDLVIDDDSRYIRQYLDYSVVGRVFWLTSNPDPSVTLTGSSRLVIVDNLLAILEYIRKEKTHGHQ
jgi:hypothetical protein